MKKLLFLLMLNVLAMSCSRSESSEVEFIDPLYGTDKGGVYVSAFYEKKLTGGAISEEKLTPGVIHIWDATNRNFDVDKSGTNIITGNLYDSNTNTMVKPIKTALYTSSFFDTFKAGKYFIYINTGDQSDYAIPKWNYSYSYFDLKFKEDVRMKKVFKLQTGTSYQPW